MSQPGFWDWKERQSKPNEKKDLLVRLSEMIEWKTFRPLLEQIHHKPRNARLIEGLADLERFLIISQNMDLTLNVLPSAQAQRLDGRQDSALK